MSVVASGASVPSSVFARALDPLEALDGLRMVARHIGEIGAGHRFRPTAAAGACRTGVYGGREEYCGKNLQQGSLVVYLMTRWSGKTETASQMQHSVEVPVMTIMAALTIADRRSAGRGLSGQRSKPDPLQVR